MSRLECLRRWLRYRRFLRLGMSGGANEEGTYNDAQVMGHRSGRSERVDSIDDAGVERLAVDAKISGVSEIELSELNDEVAVFGGVDGSETADAATRQIINVDSSGRVRVLPEGTTTLGAGTRTSIPAGIASTQIVAANPARKSLMISNRGTTNVVIGPSGVTRILGIQLNANGGLMVFNSPWVPTNAIFCVNISDGVVGAVNTMETT